MNIWGSLRGRTPVNIGVVMRNNTRISTKTMTDAIILQCLCETRNTYGPEWELWVGNIEKPIMVG